MRSGPRHNDDLSNVKADKQQPTADELAGISWWNSMTEAERAAALKAAGWKSGGTFTPSAADAWAEHKRRLRSEEGIA
jgi:hypothetical protein